MLSLFHVGERYRDLYQVEYVVRFFDGELAVARKDSVRYYLQSAHLQKQAPSRAITQYRSLKHPLIIPFEEVYTEERSIVFIRPYVPIHPLRETVSTREVNEDQVIQWVKQLLILEKELKSKPMKMYLLLDPRNIGLTEDGELKVFFCGIENITAQPKTLDWGSFIYSLLTGGYLEEKIDKVPADFGSSKWMIRLIQRSLGNDSPESVLSHIENYERKKEGKGLFGILFNGEKKVRQKIRQNLGSTRKESPAPEEIPPGVPAGASEMAKSGSPENKDDRSAPAENQIHKQDEENLERLRQEFEQRQKELLEKQRLELERRQQELLEQQRIEFARREEALLNQQKEEFKQQIEEPEQQKNWEREQQEREQQIEEQKRREEKIRLEKEQLERELRKEQAKIAKEQEERLKAELEKVEQERLKWEQKQKDLEKKEEELREKLQREFEQMAKSLMEKQEKEFERQQNELLEKQRELLESKTKQRLEKQREELEQTSKHYLITARKKPQASLIDFGKEEKEKIAKQERLEEERQKELERERERLRKEKLAREKEEHDQLVKQFEEYMNQMYHTD